jgi:hypothetical protein
MLLIFYLEIMKFLLWFIIFNFCFIFLIVKLFINLLRRTLYEAKCLLQFLLTECWWEWINHTRSTEVAKGNWLNTKSSFSTFIKNFIIQENKQQ